MQIQADRYWVLRFLKSSLCYGLIVSLAGLLTLDARAVAIGGLDKADQRGVDAVMPVPSIDVSEVGYAACRGLVSYGGKLFAVWLAGSNPIGATVLLVGLAGGQVGGRGFDAVARYLTAQNITPPSEADIEAFMDDFVEIEDEPILEIREDENGEMVTIDENGVPVEVEVLPADQEPIELTYPQWLVQTARSALDTGYQGALGLVDQLPRMGTATLTGALAGMVAQLVGGEVLAALANAGTNNLAGQVYGRIEVVMLERHVARDEPVVMDNTEEAYHDPRFNPVDDIPMLPRVTLHEGWDAYVLVEDYNPRPNAIPYAEAEIFGLIDGFEWVEMRGALQAEVAQGSFF